MLLGSVTSRCLQLIVERFTLYWEATCVYEISSSSSRDFICSIAAKIGSILVELEVLAIGVQRCVSVFRMQSANPCTARTGTLPRLERGNATPTPFTYSLYTLFNYNPMLQAF
jgi:hypothetical protein